MAKVKTTTPEVQQEKQYAPLEYEVNIYPSKFEGTQKATATVNINGQFAIRGLKIIDGSKGLFVSAPSFKAGNGEYKDICFPCTKESKAAFDKVVLDAYQQKMAESQTVTSQEAPAPQQEQGQQMATM